MLAPFSYGQGLLLHDVREVLRHKGEGIQYLSVEGYVLRIFLPVPEFDHNALKFAVSIHVNVGRSNLLLAAPLWWHGRWFRIRLGWKL